MPQIVQKKPKRNRAAEAKAGGRRLCMFELSIDASAMIDAAKAYLVEILGNCTRTQAAEWLLRQGFQKIPKKNGKRH